MQEANQEADNFFEGYDAGYRQGVFDKCNDHPHRYGDWNGYNLVDNAFNINYSRGYEDAWESNDVRI